MARHDIASRDPIGARLLSEALAGHVTGRTRRGYESAVKKYIDFCAIRDTIPFPVDELWLAMYILDVATSIKVSSLKVYLSAIQYVQVLEGFEWRLRGNELVRRAMRFVKRRYPCLSKAPKLPVSTSVLLRMVRYVSGWPRWSLLDPHLTTRIITPFHSSRTRTMLQLVTRITSTLLLKFWMKSSPLTRRSFV